MPKLIKTDISKETLECLFHGENISKMDICSRLNITIGVLERLLRENNIAPKTKEEKNMCREKSKKAKGIWKDFPISDEDLLDMSITQNMCNVEIAEKLGIKVGRVIYKLKQLGVKKDAGTINESTKKYFLEKFNVPYAVMKSGNKEKSKQAICEKLKENNYLHNRRTIIDKDSYIKDFYSGYFSNAKLAEKYKISLSTVKSYNKEFGLKKTLELKSEEMIRTKISDFAYELFSDREKLKKYMNDNKLYNGLSISKKLGVGVNFIYKKLKEFDLNEMLSKYSSNGEREVREFIRGLSISVKKDRSILSPLEVDIFCPDYNIGIEYNGSYWHSSLQKDKSYHFNKTKECCKKGIRLIHIYEHEWNDPVKQEIIKSLLRIAFGKVANRIYARNCEIREITNAEAKPFNNANHLQGHRNAQVTYGLFYNNNLVQLMSFSRTLNAKRNGAEWEIIRGCPGSNNIVVGGVSKLFSHFLKEYTPESIFSYCDFNKFDGSGYEALGMKFVGYTGPDMKWLMPDLSVEERKPSMHKFFVENSLGKIWGAGSKKYLWDTSVFIKS